MAMRLPLLVFLPFVGSLIGCDGGTVVIEVQLTGDPAGGFVTIQPAGAGVDVERPFQSADAPLALTDATQRVCVTVHGPAGEVNLRMRRCENETCTGASDSIPRVHTANIPDAIHTGKTTNVRLGPFRVDANTTVDRCDVRGCVDRFTETFCRAEDGAHFCEFMGDVEPTPECDVRQVTTL